MRVTSPEQDEGVEEEIELPAPGCQIKESMRLFGVQGFNEGSWVSGVAKLLRRRPILTSKQLASREWRGTLTQGLPALHWLQFEPLKYTGPAFWLGKPAVVAWDNLLYAGYYIERGYPEPTKPEYGAINPEQIMDRGWHWYEFLDVLKNQAQRDQLNTLMENLPTARRCVSLRARRPGNRIPYQNQISLQRMETAISDCDANEWIDLILGVSFTLDECLSLQDSILDELRAPLIRAREIDDLVLQQHGEAS